MFRVDGSNLFHKEDNNFNFSVTHLTGGDIILSYNQAKFLNQNIIADNKLILDFKHIECKDTLFKASEIYLPQSFSDNSTLDNCHYDGKVFYTSTEELDRVIKKHEGATSKSAAERQEIQASFKIFDINIMLSKDECMKVHTIHTAIDYEKLPQSKLNVDQRITHNCIKLYNKGCAHSKLCDFHIEEYSHDECIGEVCLIHQDL